MLQPDRRRVRTSAGSRGGFARVLDSWAFVFVVVAALHVALVLATLAATTPAPVERPGAIGFTLLAGPSGLGAPAPGGEAPPEPVEAPQPVAIPELPIRPGAEVVLPDRGAQRRAAVRRVERQERIQEALRGVVGEGSGTGAPGEGTGGGAWGGGGVPGGGGGGGDPALAVWREAAEGALREAFHPPPAVGGPQTWLVQVLVSFDPATGAIRDERVYRGSGNAAVDAAALRAVRSVAALPPPPERWRDVVGTRLLVDFVPP